MKFKITRTSLWGDEKPCDEAKRPKDGKGWVINIKTLDSLVKFVKKYGKTVVNEDSIEIYDYWRE